MKVTFCGHRQVEDQAKLREWLVPVIEQLILEGATEFFLGGYGAFDNMAAGIVKELKGKYPDIKSTLVIPYLDRVWDTSAYDETVYPPIENVPRQYAIVDRNEYMVEKSDIVVAYVLHSWGGASSTLRYAEKRGKRIIRFPEQQKDFRYPTVLAMEEINAMELEDNEIRFRIALRENRKLSQHPKAEALRKRLDALPIGSELGLRIARDISHEVSEMDILNNEG